MSQVRPEQRNLTIILISIRKELYLQKKMLVREYVG